MDPRRRRLLGVTATALLAGCLTGSDATPTTTSTSTGTGTTTATTTATTTTTTTEFDGLTVSDPGPPASWRATLPGTAAPPALDERRVFTGVDGDAIFALDRASGEGVWATPIEQEVRAPPFVQRGTLFVETGVYGLGGTPTLLALDPSTGAVHWEFTIDAPSGSRASIDRVGATDRAVFLATSDDREGASGETLYALGHDGSVRWSREIGDPRLSSVTPNGVFVEYGGAVHAFDPADGTHRWQRGGELGHPPVTLGDLTFLVFQDDPRRLVALETATGSERWTLDEWTVTGVARHGSSILVAGDRVAMLDPDGSDGPTTRWDRDLRGYLGRQGIAPTDGDSLFLTDPSGALAVDEATGETVWTHALDGDFTQVSAVAGDTLLVRFRDEAVWALATGDGRERWSIRRSNAGDVSGTATAPDAAVVAAGETVTSYTV